MEEGRGNGGKICWVINYPSLYIHNFLLNKYANTASPLPSLGSAVGMTVNWRRGPWGGGLLRSGTRLGQPPLSLTCRGSPGPLASIITQKRLHKASGLCLLHITSWHFYLSSRLPGLKVRQRARVLSCSGFCLLPQPHFLSFSLLASVSQPSWPPT